MYYFKKILLLNRRLKLIRKIGKLKTEIFEFNKRPLHYENKILALEKEIEIKYEEIEAIDKNLTYLQNEKPAITQKISNNSLNVGASNESGAHIQLPPIIEN